MTFVRVSVRRLSVLGNVVRKCRRKKQAPEMSQPVARESFQLFFYDRIFHLRVFWGGGGGEVLIKLAQQ